MASRLNLQKDLINLLGSKHVYFDPPESIKLQYPCFIYQSDIPYTLNANNHLYKFNKRYSVTYVDENPDNDMTERLLDYFQYASAGNPYTSDDLHHYPFDIYY